MTEKQALIAMANIETKILLIRGQKVMLDADLAELYAVETKVLNRAVKHNIERFPNDFMFQLSTEEFDITNWHLKMGRSSLSAVCLYRTRRIHALKCITEQPRH